ncbi:hypothetical protein [Silvimonas iriomotensis]|uniref:Uncharacterized protein n=1 Tax=Silvimonas iriomotensis TaxID=449662 RepID=A0ABQ2PBB0_9NEIS|nr:hypothetical protein [Silvimonas iriomotensis]GGP22834.1 hypothetical protein GCM10010970_28340 [Silvimonas iriomotensis]
MKAPSCTGSNVYLHGQVPASVTVPAAMRTLLVYVFENATAMLSLRGLAGGEVRLQPGEFLVAPVQPGAMIQLASERGLAQHALIRFVPDAAPRAQRCKCEIPVDIGPGWRARKLSAPDVPTLLDAYLETAGAWTPASTAPFCDQQEATVKVLRGEVSSGGLRLGEGEAGVVRLDTPLLASMRSHVLVQA